MVALACCCGTVVMVAVVLFTVCSVSITVFVVLRFLQLWSLFLWLRWLFGVVVTVFAVEAGFYLCSVVVLVFVVLLLLRSLLLGCCCGCGRCCCSRCFCGVAAVAAFVVA